MAIQVTGSFKYGYVHYSDPQLQLVPHLTYRSSIAMDVYIAVPTYSTNIINNEEVTSVSYHQLSAIPMYPSISELEYSAIKEDPYSDLIHSLETYVISQVSGSNPTCTFNRI